MAFDAFALILPMLGIGMLFARLRVLPLPGASSATAALSVAGWRAWQRRAAVVPA